MKKYLLQIVSAILILASLGSASSFQGEASAEEYAVYCAVITNMFAGDRVTFDTQSKIKVLVIEDQTSTDLTASLDSDQDGQSFKRIFPTLAEGVVNDYRVKNKEPALLKDSFDLKLKHVLVQKQEIEKVFNDGGWWQEFYKRYPDSGGFIILSRVGFNAGMNQALVYIQHGCGGLCGTGHYVLLEKSLDGWKVSKRSMVWIS